MAYVILPRPGTEYGPCEEACEHRDCAQTREIAAATCRLCGEPIGYETKASADDAEYPGRYIHSLCGWKELDRRVTEMQASA